MAKKKRKDVTESGELDMTPMIDVVFNLLIFFLIISDLTQKDMAQLTLPIANMAAEDEDNDPDDRIIINIDNQGQLLFRGLPRSLDELGTILSEAKRVYNLKMKSMGKEGTEEVAPGAKASKLFVLLRADRNTPWQHVQWIMTIMAEEKLYKLQFATKKYVDGDYTEEQAKALDGIYQKDVGKAEG